MVMSRGGSIQGRSKCANGLNSGFAPISAGRRSGARHAGPDQSAQRASVTLPSPRAVRIEPLRLGQRPREQLPRRDREQRREQRHGGVGTGSTTRRPRSARPRSRSRSRSRPARARARGGLAHGGQALVVGSDRPDGEEPVDRRHGPWTRSVAVSGSAATRQVSSSFSEISRAVAYSGPRPITNIRPTNASETAISDSRALERRQQRRELRGVARMPVGDRRRLGRGVGGEQRQRGELRRVGLRRRDRALAPAAERQDGVGRLGELRFRLVRDRDRERAAAASALDVLDHVRRLARLRERDDARAAEVDRPRRSRPRARSSRASPSSRGRSPKA